MGDNLFQGLPPPSAPPPPQPSAEQQQSSSNSTTTKESPPNPPPPVLKSALKRTKPTEPQPEANVPEKRLRFKTTTDASETQVIEAMQKITSHIKNPDKFGKASKLAIQLIQAGSVKSETSDHFFSILESSMSSPTACNDTSVRADYHALFSAAQDAVEFFNKKQRNQLTTWMMRAVVANDLFTDDSFVYSKAAGRIKEAILNLPVATKEEDMEEAAALKDKTEAADVDSQTKPVASSVATAEGNDKDDSDPFGLDALIPSTLKKDDKTKGKKEAATKIKEEEEETKRFLKSQREALILCLEIAARRYKTPWSNPIHSLWFSGFLVCLFTPPCFLAVLYLLRCLFLFPLNILISLSLLRCQTTIDILVKHAFDNISRFTSKQRDAIEKLWASIREQQTHRKQGKSVSGKLDVNGFEWLQQKYANEKISIRHSVGGSGDRKAQQWLG